MPSPLVFVEYAFAKVRASGNERRVSQTEADHSAYNIAMEFWKSPPTTTIHFFHPKA